MALTKAFGNGGENRVGAATAVWHLDGALVRLSTVSQANPLGLGGSMSFS
jgi:hypothetical protein